jgi:hypothetical protein
MVALMKEDMEGESTRVFRVAGERLMGRADVGDRRMLYMSLCIISANGGAFTRFRAKMFVAFLESVFGKGFGFRMVVVVMREMFAPWLATRVLIVCRRESRTEPVVFVVDVLRMSRFVRRRRRR